MAAATVMAAFTLFTVLEAAPGFVSTWQILSAAQLKETLVKNHNLNQCNIRGNLNANFLLGWICCSFLCPLPPIILLTITHNRQSSQEGKQELSASLKDRTIIYCSDSDSETEVKVWPVSSWHRSQVFASSPYGIITSLSDVIAPLRMN